MLNFVQSSRIRWPSFWSRGSWSKAAPWPWTWRTAPWSWGGTGGYHPGVIKHGVLEAVDHRNVIIYSYIYIYIYTHILPLKDSPLFLFKYPPFSLGSFMDFPGSQVSWLEDIIHQRHPPRRCRLQVWSARYDGRTLRPCCLAKEVKSKGISVERSWDVWRLPKALARAFGFRFGTNTSQV